jgi:hypothetical protein
VQNGFPLSALGRSKCINKLFRARESLSLRRSSVSHRLRILSLKGGPRTILCSLGHRFPLISNLTVTLVLTNHSLSLAYCADQLAVLGICTAPKRKERELIVPKGVQRKACCLVVEVGGGSLQRRRGTAIHSCRRVYAQGRPSTRKTPSSLTPKFGPV